MTRPCAYPFRIEVEWWRGWWTFRVVRADVVSLPRATGRRPTRAWALRAGRRAARRCNRDLARSRIRHNRAAASRTVVRYEP